MAWCSGVEPGLPAGTRTQQQVRRSLCLSRSLTGGNARHCLLDLEVQSSARVAVAVALAAKLAGQREPHLGLSGFDL
jgi:hypothetical protein